MRIAVLASNVFDLPTGQQKVQRSVIKALDGKDSELLLITNAKQVPEGLVEWLGLDFCRLLVLPGIATAKTYLKGYRSICRALERFQPNLIFSFGGASVALGAALKKRTGLPWIHFSYEIACFRTFLGRYYRYCLNKADSVICTSHFLKHDFLAHGAVEKNITVLRYNFGDTNVMVRESLREKGSERKNLLFWGDAVEGRGLDIFLRVVPPFLKEGKVTLSLALRYIDERYRDQLRNIEHLPGAKIVGGAIEAPQLREFLASSDIVVLPYVVTTMQPPLTLLESVGSEKLVISTDIDANREVVGENREGGILIPPRSESHLRDALDGALSNFESHQERLQRYLQKEKWLIQPDENQLKHFLSDLRACVLSLNSQSSKL